MGGTDETVWYTRQDDALDLRLYVSPKVSKNKVCGVFNQRLKIQITAPPVDGKANQHLVKWLAKYLKITKSHIEIITGERGRNKRLRILTDSPRKLIASLQATLTAR